LKNLQFVIPKKLPFDNFIKRYFMDNFSDTQVDETAFPFWDDMIQMVKELPSETQMLLYKTVKKMYALELANKFDKINRHFQLNEVLLDDLLLKVENE
jgi:hypothetical protein